MLASSSVSVAYCTMYAYDNIASDQQLRIITGVRFVKVLFVSIMQHDVCPMNMRTMVF